MFTKKERVYYLSTDNIEQIILFNRNEDVKNIFFCEEKRLKQRDRKRCTKVH